MANIKVNEFVAAALPLVTSDIVYAKQGSTEKKITVSELRGELSSVDNSYTASGTASVINLAPSGKTVAPSEYFDGLRVLFKVLITNTATVTINVNGLGARNLYNINNDAVLAPGELAAGKTVEAVYDSTNNRFHLLLSQTLFPNIENQTTVSETELDILDGATLSTTELNHVDGVTSPIQTQLDSKQFTVTGAAATIVFTDLIPNRALVSTTGGKVSVSTVSDAELGRLYGSTAGTVLTTGDEGSLDAGTLDGLDSTQYLRSDVSTTNTDGNIISKSNNSTANAHFWLKASTGSNVAVLYSDEDGNDVTLLKYLPDGVTTHSYLRMDGSGDLVFNGNEVWDDGNTPATSTGQEKLGVYHGRVKAEGDFWRLPTGWSVSRISIGYYEVTHNLGTTAFTPIVSIYQGAGGGAHNIQVASRTSNTFRVLIYDVSDVAFAQDKDFSFWVALD